MVEILVMSLTRELTPGYDPYSHNPYRQTDVVEPGWLFGSRWSDAELERQAAKNRWLTAILNQIKPRAPQTPPEPPKEPDSHWIGWL